ncbi:MAG TPA: FAD-dependent oxidoreductase, partial [Nitrospiraceae bacterium]|nr:FAD-dependent oxidoreductase [Nitrospiraceae bacterium]
MVRSDEEEAVLDSQAYMFLTGTTPLMLPDDEHNRRLLGNVHPASWKNPEPSERYNIVVIGAGTAGLVTAAIAAGIGAKAALVERDLMGGDCLNVGCVPSKAMIRASRAWADLKRAGEFGLQIPAGVGHDFGTAMERMRRLRAHISPTDSAVRFTKLGVDVYFGTARFAGGEIIAVEGPAGNRRLTFSKAAVCTG